jgi:hypothetical protein
MEADIQNRGQTILPGVYHRDATNYTAVPFNSAGWDPREGTCNASVVFFVDDPNCLILDLENTTTTETLHYIRAKVGLEELKRDFIEPTESGFRLVFHGPSRPAYSKGIQQVCIAMVPKVELGDVTSRWRLRRVEWKR